MYVCLIGPLYMCAFLYVQSQQALQAALPDWGGVLMSTQCGWVMLKYVHSKTKSMGSSRAPGDSGITLLI